MASDDTTSNDTTSNGTTSNAATPRAGTIVVGVDGSPHSAQAVRWALTQAALTSASVRAVTCWEWPPSLGVSGYIDVDLAEANREVAQTLLDEVQAAMKSEGLQAASEVHVDLQVLEGYPGRALVQAAQGAELLVVGSRGRGALGRMLLGSVGLYSASHAPCPVLIVREPADVPSSS